MHGRGRPSALDGTWIVSLAALALLRALVPLAALLAAGSRLPGFPRWDFVAFTGDAAGFHAAAREYMAAWGRIPEPLLALFALTVVAGAAAIAHLGRTRAAWRHWLVAAATLGAGLTAVVAVTRMEPAGAAVLGWSLLWGTAMLPVRAAGVEIGLETAFGFGLALSVAANAATVVATGYAGRWASGSKAVGVAAAGIFAVWPFLTGVLAGPRGWDNGTWAVDAGLHLYGEPLSTALVTTALALLLRPGASPVPLALAGAALGIATSVKLSNGIVAAFAAAVLARRLGARRALPFALAGLAWTPVVAAYWPLGYPEHFGNPRSWPRDPFTPENATRAWTESLLFSPRVLAVILPLAVAGAWALRAALPLLAVFVLVNAVFYSFYAVTPQHPRFLHASLPALFVLVAAGADLVRAAVGRLSAGPCSTPCRTTSRRA